MRPLRFKIFNLRLITHNHKELSWIYPSLRYPRNPTWEFTIGISPAAQVGLGLWCAQDIWDSVPYLCHWLYPEE